MKSNKLYAAIAALLGMILATEASAQGALPPGAAPVPISATERDQAIAALERVLHDEYVFPEVAERVSAGLEAKRRAGAYANLNETHAFSEALTTDLRALGKDRHLRVEFDPGFVPSADQDGPTPPEIVAQMKKESDQFAGGVGDVRRLPGNVAYLDLRAFLALEYSRPALDAAMALVAGSEALILDLRRNGGGEPDTVAYLLSHFFPLGDERHLNDLYFRPKNVTREYWTTPAVHIRYDKPVYVLTSARTFSGAEECAYDFQTQKRAVLIGETTGGGANPGDYFPIGSGLNAFVPTGRAINPITHTNWEHVGVKPDIAIPAPEAAQRAYADVLKDLIASSKDPQRTEGLTRLLAIVEKGEFDLPRIQPTR
jgi:hypothetical protein